MRTWMVRRQVGLVAGDLGVGVGQLLHLAGLVGVPVGEFAARPARPRPFAWPGRGPGRPPCARRCAGHRRRPSTSSAGQGSIRPATGGLRVHHARAARPCRRAGPGSARRPGSAAGRRPGLRPSGRRLCGSFSRHFRQIVSRSRGTSRLSSRGGTGSCVDAPACSVSSERRGLRTAAGPSALVEDRPQRVDVGRRADVAAVARGLLGGHVAAACP